MKIVWDEPKRRSNIRKHGLDFEEVERFGWVEAMVGPTHPGSRGEPRFKATGILDDELVTMVFAPLGSEAISLISFRMASRRERRAYAKRQETLPH